MHEPLPKYELPPVHETALSIQFERLPSFSGALAGWFWKSYMPGMPGNWSRATETVRLEDVFEKFGTDAGWHRLGFRMVAAGEPQRIQIIREDSERMVQLQDSRLVLNWQKKEESGYPSFEVMSMEFAILYPLFKKFAQEAELGKVEPNQWEVTYVNLIRKDDMWSSALDWGKIIPSFVFPPPAKDIRGETANCEFRYILPGERGRMYVSMRHVKVAPSDEEAINLTLTCRGPIDNERGWGFDEGFNLGHQSIVRSFTAMTSKEAHQRWKRSI
jgi:uncharacterized protein (TIGR04255 family)